MQSKWPKQAIIENAAPYTSFRKWSKENSGAYKSAVRHGWLEEIRATFAKHNRHWTKEAVLANAAPCKSKKEWAAKSQSAYYTAKQRGWFEEATAHMPPDPEKIGRPYKYTQEDFDKSAAPFTYFRDWFKAHKNMAESALRSGRVPQHLRNMRPKVLPENLIEESARRYKYTGDWQRNEINFYSAARRRGQEFFRKVTAHMAPRTSNTRARFQIYVYKFNVLKKAYVGITSRPRHRHYVHQRCKGPVRAIIKQGHPWSLKILASRLKSSKARDVERRYIVFYEQLGWSMLNRSRGGETGSVRSWTFEKVLESVKHYDTFADWAKHERAALSAANRHGWIGRIKKMFPVTIKWPKEKVLESLNGFSRFSAWAIAFRGAHKSAIRNGWLEEIQARFTLKRKPWTREEILASAAACKTRNEWCVKSPGAHSAANQLGCYAEATAHMPKRAPRGSATAPSRHLFC